MNEATCRGWPAVCHAWYQTVADVARLHWDLLAAQQRAGAAVVAAVLGQGVRPAAPAAPPTLAEEATARLRQGLAPPRAIYDVQNRELVDWASLPGWARPVDPEMFEGTGHEG